MRNAAEFASATDDVFGRIARRYDWLCDLFSLGIHRLWKRRVAQLILAQPWESMLDSASGTGDIVDRVLSAKAAAHDCRVIAADLSPAMLEVAKRRLTVRHQGIEIRRLDAEAMPDIPSDSVDLYSISLGLKICDRTAVLREALRVLKSGGRIVVLEASDIPVRWLHRLYLAYMGACMPVIGWIASGGDASAYQYLLRGIREFPGAEGLAKEMEAVGLCDMSFERLTFGIVAIHVGYKPRAQGNPDAQLTRSHPP